MDGPREHYSKWNKPVRERQIPYDFSHMWNLMNKLNYQAKWRQTHRWRAGWQLWVVGLGVEGSEQKGKRTHGHSEQWWLQGEGVYKEINVNGKIKLKKFKKNKREKAE